MRQSKFFVKTKRSVPKEAEAASHQLLLKGDYIEQLASGIYSFLPLGWRVHKNIENIIREEMNAIGGQEVFMSALQPKEIWLKTGRWEKIDPPLFKVKDRHEKELALGSTHEEVIAQLASSRINSYKDLPLYLYQIQNKFRNEMRATGGLLRTREFIMKDLYSFHATQEDFKKYYSIVLKSYLKIFKRCKLKAVVTEASGAGFTQEFTHEFQILTPTGEDTVIYCQKCSFAQNKEISKWAEGDKCPQCGFPLSKARGIEAGNIFPLGEKYSKDMGVSFKDKNGAEKPAIMGCYGIGLGRLMATIAEIHHDDKGIIWPDEVAPFKIHLLPLDSSSQVKKPAEKIYNDLLKQKTDVLYDDREKSAGEKFADSDLIGIPLRVVISERTIKSNSLEIKKRGEKNAKIIKISQLAKFLKDAK